MEIASIIISLLALIIAGFTLWYTYKARIDAKIQTTELSKQNEILKAKNRIDILPELYIKNIGTYSVRIEDFLKFDINNKGENATLLSINVLSQNLKIISSPFPLDLNKGEQIYLHFIYTRNQYIEADEYY